MSTIKEKQSILRILILNDCCKSFVIVICKYYGATKDYDEYMLELHESL